MQRCAWTQCRRFAAALVGLALGAPVAPGARLDAQVRLDSVGVDRTYQLRMTLPNPTGIRPDRQVVRWGYSAGGPGTMDTIPATGRDSVFLYASPTAAWTIWACRDAVTNGVTRTDCTTFSKPQTAAVVVPHRPSQGSGSEGTAAASSAAEPHSRLYAREPAGYQRIAESRFDGVPANETRTSRAPGVVAGCWYRFSRLVEQGSDSTAPISPPGVLKYTWPARLPIGTSAGMFGAWDGCSSGKELSRTEYRGIYESGWFKLQGTSFETPDVGMKLLGYWGVGEGRDPKRVGNQIYTLIQPGGIRNAFTVHWLQQGPVSRRMPANVNAAPLITVGRWVRYEVLMTLNDVNVPNGTLKVWINGTLTHDYRDVVWRTRAAPSGFFERRWDPVWGGMGNPPFKTRADGMLVDQVYISGIK